MINTYALINNFRECMQSCSIAKPVKIISIGVLGNLVLRVCWAACLAPVIVRETEAQAPHSVHQAVDLSCHESFLSLLLTHQGSLPCLGCSQLSLQ